MEEGKVEEILAKIESEFDSGNFGAARELGFWKVVGAAKKDPALAEGFAERIGRIDRLLFESKVWRKLGYGTGTIVELMAAVVGVIFLYLAALSTGIEGTVFYVASALTLMTALHPISHSIAARLTGIEFHFYFLNGPLLIEPTLKVDYSTYIRTSAGKRSFFHLAGALNSVIVTLLVFLAALYDPNAEPMAKILLAAIWLFTTSSEVFPLLFTRLGIPKLFFADFRKTDSYRALREWRLGR